MVHPDHPKQTEDPTTKKWVGKSLIFWKLLNCLQHQILIFLYDMAFNVFNFICLFVADIVSKGTQEPH